MSRVVVHGRGKKHGEIADLHPERRTLVDAVLSTGYLADAEAALQRGELADYYLFPAGRLKEGRVLVEQCVGQPLWPTATRGMCRVLEADAGVKHQQGRSSTACDGRRWTRRPSSSRTRAC